MPCSATDAYGRTHDSTGVAGVSRRGGGVPGPVDDLPGADAARPARSQPVADGLGGVRCGVGVLLRGCGMARAAPPTGRGAVARRHGRAPVLRRVVRRGARLGVARPVDQCLPRRDRRGAGRRAAAGRGATVAYADAAARVDSPGHRGSQRSAVLAVAARHARYLGGPGPRRRSTGGRGRRFPAHLGCGRLCTAGPGRLVAGGSAVSAGAATRRVRRAAPVAGRGVSRREV